jgi:ketosteroid isomerase-like protein
MSQENVDLVRAFLGAYNARDAEACDRLLDPGAEITTVTTRAGLPWASWRQGQSSRYFDGLAEAWSDLRIEIEDYRDLGDRVLALGSARGTGKASEIRVEAPFATLFVVRNSLLARVDSYDDLGEALEAAGLSE